MTELIMDCRPELIGRVRAAEYRTLMRLDRRTFTERAFGELNPSTDLTWNWHIEAIVDKLEACRRGEIRRLIINVPVFAGHAGDQACERLRCQRRRGIGPHRAQDRTLSRSRVNAESSDTEKRF